MIFMSAALLLSSCGLYNKYERPDVNADGLVRDPFSMTDTLAVTDTTSFGNLPWRSIFTDPQLQALIQQGLENNPDLLNAALNVHMVNEALKIAKLAFLPSVARYAVFLRWCCCYKVIFSACLCKLEYRPLWQPAFRQAFCPDAADRHQGLSDGGKVQCHLRHRQPLLFVAGLRPSGRDSYRYGAVDEGDLGKDAVHA